MGLGDAHGCTRRARLQTPLERGLSGSSAHPFLPFLGTRRRCPGTAALGDAVSSCTWPSSAGWHAAVGPALRAAGAPALSCTAFPGASARSWTRSGAAGTLTGAHRGCRCHRRRSPGPRLSPLASNISTAYNPAFHVHYAERNVSGRLQGQKADTTVTNGQTAGGSRRVVRSARWQEGRRGEWTTSCPGSRGEAASARATEDPVHRKQGLSRIRGRTVRGDLLTRKDPA